MPDQQPGRGREALTDSPPKKLAPSRFSLSIFSAPIRVLEEEAVFCRHLILVQVLRDSFSDTFAHSWSKKVSIASRFWLTHFGRMKRVFPKV